MCNIDIFRAIQNRVKARDLKQLIKNGANINEVRGIDTPLSLAVKCNFASAVDILLRAGAKGNGEDLWKIAFSRRRYSVLAQLALNKFPIGDTNEY